MLAILGSQRLRRKLTSELAEAALRLRGRLLCGLRAARVHIGSLGTGWDFHRQRLGLRCASGLTWRKHDQLRGRGRLGWRVLRLGPRAVEELP